MNNNEDSTLKDWYKNKVSENKEEKSFVDLNTPLDNSEEEENSENKEVKEETSFSEKERLLLLLIKNKNYTELLNNFISFKEGSFQRSLFNNDISERVNKREDSDNYTRQDDMMSASAQILKENKEEILNALKDLLENIEKLEG